MDPPEVDDQLAVDVDPHVVVALEEERLAAMVGEGALKLHGEVEVVRFTIQSNGRVAPALAVERKEACTLVQVRALFGALQGEPYWLPLVHARNIAVPLVEVRLARQDRAPAEDGLAVCPEVRLHKAGEVAAERLEVRVLHLEVPSDPVQDDLGRNPSLQGPPRERHVTALQEHVLPGGHASKAALAATCCSALRGALRLGSHSDSSSQEGARVKQCRGHRHVCSSRAGGGGQGRVPESSGRGEKR
mmetsp:Transcript_22925/g.71951  ORF Transcript_22925/g.71951 Transcript_22925/m.71951 type:complete len:246 (+) Transcript_22925:1071-1808(+)